MSGLRYLVLTVILFALLFPALNCRHDNPVMENSTTTRQYVDTVGFARYSWQMDSIMARIERGGWKEPEGSPWRLVICPHDDYTYVGSLYPEILKNIKASKLILVGVAHKAAQLGIEDSIVFGNFSYWKGPWKAVPVSQLRDLLFEDLGGKYAMMSDTLQTVEHSIEAMIPFLQYFNRDISIVPVLVPAMPADRMKECARAFAETLKSIANENRWEWGKDFAIIVTTDAVHYGNEDWGGADMAFFGCDSAGNRKALLHEHEIIDKTLTGKLTPEKISLFSSFTLNPDNYKEYKWTWCGRYSVPFTLYLSYFLDGHNTLEGRLVGYSSSITSNHIPVDDIGMGRTAIATDCHWVGYAAVGYR
jgi:AmmeMemoRadiSam system protein B